MLTVRRAGRAGSYSESEIFYGRPLLPRSLAFSVKETCAKSSVVPIPRSESKFSSSGDGNEAVLDQRLQPAWQTCDSRRSNFGWRNESTRAEIYAPMRCPCASFRTCACLHSRGCQGIRRPRRPVAPPPQGADRLSRAPDWMGSGPVVPRPMPLRDAPRLQRLLAVLGNPAGAGRMETAVAN